MSTNTQESTRTPAQHRDRMIEIINDESFLLYARAVQAKYQPLAGIDETIAVIPGISGLEMLGLQQMRNAGVMMFLPELHKLVYPQAKSPLGSGRDPRSPEEAMSYFAKAGGFEEEIPKAN